jgi:hypothetical protein
LRMTCESLKLLDMSFSGLVKLLRFDMHLPTDEGKTRSKLDQELGDVFDERIFDGPLFSLFRKP